MNGDEIIMEETEIGSRVVSHEKKRFRPNLFQVNAS